jgi:hypothetical protein
MRTSVEHLRGPLRWKRTAPRAWRALSFYGVVEVRGARTKRNSSSASRGRAEYEYFLPWCQLPSFGFGPFAAPSRAKRAAEQSVRRRLSEIAHHEAAHVVIGHLFGVRFKRIAAELVPASSGSRWNHGLTHFVGSDVLYDGSVEKRRELEEGVIVLLAGAAAQRALGCSYDGSKSSAEGDYDKAREIIDAMHRFDEPTEEEDPWRWSGIAPDQRRRLLLEALEQRADKLLAEGFIWQSVTQVAVELLDRRVLSAKRARVILPNRSLARLESISHALSQLQRQV